ncbi:ammonium transporter [Nocardia yunnanensis]|uniref:Ammonium transporter n=1 Tax=Nocardia yunnanensis TaxID=2382165 RepID=A0A386Z882_9NOCA|nr:ammonium transporter [Nocardia yunnanensis]AYF73413.1 ammonium transporter [Nocardia yunnanensis]
MMLRKITAIAAPVVTAVAIAGAGVAHADSAVPDIGYQTQLVGDTVVTTLTNGSFELAGGAVNIKDAEGATVVSLPTSFEQDGLSYPLPTAVSPDGATLSQTAVKDVAAATPVLHPVASLDENQRAMQAFTSQFGIATAIGSFVGLAIGAAVGAIGFLGGAFGLATVPVAATVGAIIGTLVVGGPALLIAGVDLISTLTAAPGTTKWAQP